LNKIESRNRDRDKTSDGSLSSETRSPAVARIADRTDCQ